MASLLQNLLRKPSPSSLRVLASIRNPNLPYPPPPSSLLHHLPIHESAPVARAPVLPSFPHWFHLVSIPLSELDPSPEEENGVEVGGDEDRTVWADSVKKKRKKKMNKHKYRKLRKRLRRQT